MKIITNNFMPKMTKKYPVYIEGLLIEEYFYDYFIKNNLNYNRIYLPVFWTGLYLSRSSGRNIDDLRNFIKNLDTTKKYFTIVQHCRGILCDITHLDILIFSSGGTGRNHDTNHFITRDIFRANNNNLGDIPLPLLANPELKYNNVKKDILCSFLGNLDNHQKLRYEMYNKLHNKENFLIDNSKDFNTYYDVLCRSKFSLCPRGVGLTSFRLYESLQCLAIPIYIYDDVAWLPYKDEIDWQDISIIIHDSEISKIYDIINNFTDEKIKQYQINIKKLINDYFTLEGTCNNINSILLKH